MAVTYQRAHLPLVLGMKRSTFFFIIYVVLYVAFLIFGGYVFGILERPGEDVRKVEFLAARSEFLMKHPCVSDNDLEALIQVVVKASNRGVSASKNATGEPNWSFGQSLFFSSTVITTIGYGHVTPLSKEGKVFCIMYALLGIPLTLVLLTASVERLMIPATLFLQYLNSRLGHLYQPFNIRLIHLCTIIVLLVSLFLFIPASIFAYIEPEWDYLDSLYYCFISLTTIGLGDYIPGDSPNQPYRPVYKVATTCYLMIGLIFVMLTLTVFYEIPQLNFGSLFTMQSDENTTDPEKVRLQNPGGLGPTYTQQRNLLTDKMDTPSPEDMTPVHARP